MALAMIPIVLSNRYVGEFAGNDKQQQVLIGFYQIVFPDWNRIIKIHGYPIAGEDKWSFICRLFQEFF
jgi:hypothetical protein